MGRYIVNVLLLLRMIKIYIVSKFKNSSTLFLLTDSPGTIETLCDFQRSSYALALFFKMASPQFSPGKASTKSLTEPPYRWCYAQTPGHTCYALSLSVGGLTPHCGEGKNPMHLRPNSAAGPCML